MTEKAKIFKDVLNSIEHKDIRDFAEQCINTIPPYFYEIGASSTGKYHPRYTHGVLGLAKHTCALVRILNHILSIDCYKNDYTPRERDLLRVAGIMHDSRKSGSQEEYEKDKYTKFNHPLLAAEIIRNVETKLPKEEVELITTTIESHMGQWNTDNKSDIVLPTPENKYQKILHLADYLASRKDLEVLFDKERIN